MLAMNFVTLLTSRSSVSICGEFVSEGLLFYDGNHDVSEILDQLEDEDNSMTMGGL